MALIDCSECGHRVSDNAVACPGCGNPQTPMKANQLNIESQKIQLMPPPRRRSTYIILALFLNGIAMHNLYAAQYNRAAIRLLILLVSCFLDVMGHAHGGLIIFVTVFSTIFAVVEAGLTEEDGDKEKMI